MAISISFAVFVIATVSCIIYKKRWHIKYYFYLLRAKNRGYEILGGDYLVDNEFVAFNSLDRVWVISKMIPKRTKKTLNLFTRQGYSAGWETNCRQHH